ncbi:MAG TPA: mechanosensitive ion channel domain-containing protein, partial [Candidatus Limnocylindria bacterium]|nr:mechanosensitive ion channel domain-containing protein [Candidatus Limnocylindria bacterium]
MAAVPLAATNIEWINQYFGSWNTTWLGQEAFLGVTWFQLLAAITALSLTFLVSRMIRHYIRREIQKQTKEKTSEVPEKALAASWFSMVLKETLPPLSMLAWVWGLFFSFWIILPAELTPATVGFKTAIMWFVQAGNIAVLFWFLFRMVSVVEWQLKRWARRDTRRWDDVLVILIIRAMRLVTPLMAVIFIVPTLDLPPTFHNFFNHAASLLLTAAVGFIFYQLVNAGEEAVLLQYRIDEPDNLVTRKVQTQVRVLKRIAVVVICIFTGASMLMVFDSVRQFGASILASAGVAGIVAGFAAQKSLSTLLAGIQIAFTQPIRWDDVVIVEGEWGRIEEIGLTYVVIRLWDLRRLIVPINYFIEKPFQNWTRVTADLVGTVMLYTDYTVPLKPLREELDRILATAKGWDGKVKVLQVTDARERSLELRILVSAPDAGIAW